MSFTIPQYPEKTVIANDDLFVIEDVAAGNTKHVTRENLLSSAPLPADTVDEQAIQNDAVTLNKIADFESGSDANGNFTKFPDGTMICRGYVEVDDFEFTTQEIGGWNRGSNQSQSFPQNFLSGTTPQVTMTTVRRDGNNEFYFPVHRIRPADTGFTWNLLAATSTTRDVAIDWIAVGRWK